MKKLIPLLVLFFIFTGGGATAETQFKCSKSKPQNTFMTRFVPHYFLVRIKKDFREWYQFCLKEKKRELSKRQIKERPIEIIKDSPTTNEVWKDKPVTIKYNGFEIETFINKPKGSEFDVILMFHGTTMNDQLSLDAALSMSKLGQEIQAGTSKKTMTISVAYKETRKLIGDELPETETTFLWLKNQASKDLGVKINKIYLLGHSRGGYIVLALNSKYKSDGVIANGSGPIDFKFRCELEEQGRMKSKSTSVCKQTKRLHGSTIENPKEYEERSVLHNLHDLKSKMLIIQGEEDKNIQMYLMPKFINKIEACKNCAEYKLLELPGVGHWAFDEPKTMKAIWNFLEER